MPNLITRRQELAAFTKINRLIRNHRNQAFDSVSGDAHCRAIRRLKNTATWRAMMARNEGEASMRNGERLTRLGY